MEETQALTWGVMIVLRTPALPTCDPAPSPSARDSGHLTLSEEAVIFY